ncbi:hypothetical protein [[Kitasatospora] papulosa]|uniref:Uncharacterized protein n=1 Tax=[Kitasatospora] papulosa TaxID=1464011 RepID=A0ABZ1KA46_9ACTN
MTAADLARVDVPLSELERRAALCRRADVVQAANSELAAAGAAAENRHLLYDADPDATVPAFVDLHHHLSTRRGTR